MNKMGVNLVVKIEHKNAVQVLKQHSNTIEYNFSNINVCHRH